MKLSPRTFARLKQQFRKNNPIQQCMDEQEKHKTYSTFDVILLIDTLENFQFTDVETKEKLIQSGQKHYSQMLSKESAPTSLQKSVFLNALEQHKEKIASGVKSIAMEIEKARVAAQKKEIVLVSLIRAGLPLGVLLQREMQNQQWPSTHYGISIIRDKGLDKKAMRAILAKHPNAYIAFIDGWVGKGAITRQLKESCQKLDIPFSLYALSDPTKELTTYSPYASDWLIPFGILGSVVSGLLSRTVFQRDKMHGAIYYDDLVQDDVTHFFINEVSKYLPHVSPVPKENTTITESDILALCKQIMHDFKVEKLNNVKPSIAEATRAVLRRVPEMVLVKSKSDTDLTLLLDLCQKNNVPVLEYNVSPYRAITIIKNS